MQIIKRLWNWAMSIRIINFMIVGGLGLIVSLAIYYPLTLVLQQRVTFLHQLFYLPAELVAIPVSITFNYYMNKKFTYSDCEAKRFSLIRYELLGLSTAFFDVLLLFLFVYFWHIYFLWAAILAALCVFVIRYTISNKWIWKVLKTEKSRA